jgi:hypothetical protein
LKPVDLSASRGVIRANGEAEFVAAFRRIGRMAHGWVQVERYIPGREFAVEGMVTRGRIAPLAIFDKPDLLEGPFFEETLYVTPSREPAPVQAAWLETTARAVRALGLWHGPWHAELRYNRERAWMLEVAARPIGGLCARALRFEGGISLEELILRHAAGEDVSETRLEGPASGVMMIPIPRAGIYQSVEGLEEARSEAAIEDIVMTAARGHRLVPLPEGASYLGFIFARAAEPATVEAALREAHAKLRFQVSASLETL